MTPKSPAAHLLVHFKTLEDPRIDRCQLHPMENLLTIALLGMLCGFGDFKGFELFGHAKKDWLATFLNLEHGAPSHDTFGRFFAALDPEEFGRCFMSWTRALASREDGRIISIDGKTVRGSFDKATDTSAIHMVSAFVQANRIVLGQLKTDMKSNEITAIPQLLGLLDISGAVVTIDAMGTQRAIAAEIVSAGADYVLPVKQNHPTLHEDISLFLEPIVDGSSHSPGTSSFETIEKDHGRIETRKAWSTSDVSWLQNLRDWEGLQSIGVIDRTREFTDGTSTHQRTFYISSCADLSAKKLLETIRSHWGVENQLHWCLDVQFGEDGSRVRTKHAAENLSLVRRVALNLLAQNPTKVGTNKKRLMALADNSFLLKILSPQTQLFDSSPVS